MSDDLLPESHPPNEPTERSFSVGSAVIFYGAMGGIAIVGSVLLRVFDENWFHVSRLDLLLGLSAAALYIILSQLYFRVSVAARSLKRELSRLIGPITPLQILLLTLGSAVGEELLFRGWLQSHFGLVVTSILFGACHGGFMGRFLPWSIASTFAGLMFGGMMQYTGSIVGPMIAHGVINGVGLTLMRMELE